MSSEIKLKVPEGYTFSGDIRVPKAGEFFLSFGLQGPEARISTRSTTVSYPILKANGVCISGEIKSSYALTIYDVYSKDVIQIPFEYEFLDFSYKRHEKATHYLTVDCLEVSLLGATKFFYYSPVIQLAKKDIKAE